LIDFIKMTNDNTINARIRELIQFLDITDNAFAKKIGVTQSVIASMFQRGTEPSAKVITSILCTYEEISAEWLLRGKGDMLFQKEETEPGMEKLKSIVYTIANLQDEINNKTMQTQRLLEENQKLKGELAMLKNERNIG